MFLLSVVRWTEIVCLRVMSFLVCVTVTVLGFIVCSLLVAVLRIATAPRKSVSESLDYVWVRLQAGSMRPALDAQLLSDLGASLLRKMEFVPWIWLSVRCGLVIVRTRRLGVHLPETDTVLLSELARTVWSLVSVPVVTLWWGNVVSRWLTLFSMVLISVGSLDMSMIRELVLRLVRDSRLVVMKVGPVLVLVTISILDGFVGTLTVVFVGLSVIRRPVLAI